MLCDPPQGLVSHLDVMIDMILALSQRVNAQAEVAHQHEDALSTSHPRSQVKRRRATLLDLPVQNFTIDQAV